VISYHLRSDPFQTPEGVARANYYGVSGTPTVYFDGLISVVGGAGYPGTKYQTYRDRFNQRIGVSSDLEITLECTYDSVANSGAVDAVVLNTTGDPINGTLHFVLIEDDKQYSWGGLTELHFTMRDMLPDASGESVTVPASDTIMRSRSFSVDPSWDELHCRIVVFAQAATKDIYQGAEIGIFEMSDMEYYGFLPVETSGNGNGIAEPGESMELTIAAKNMGTGTYDGTPSVQCDDSYITVTGSTPASVSMGPGDVDSVVTVMFDISPSCPDPHLTYFEIDFGSPIDSIPFVVTTTPGFADSIEDGENGWTHSGLREYWHITEHKSHTPTHSWYCGLEGTWLYNLNNDGSLVTPYFVPETDSHFYFHHIHFIQNYVDYGNVDIDNGSGWWQTLDVITGTQATWAAEEYSLDDYVGQTIRFRFRFMSSHTVHWEGWYIDDVATGHPIGIQEDSDKQPHIINLNIYPNPFSRALTITYEVTSDHARPITISIYDAAGRLVKSFEQSMTAQSHHIIWTGTDDFGRELPGGIYFIVFDNTEQSSIEKAILLR
jgi:hypothetical protein